MIFNIDNLLTGQQLAQIQKGLDQAKFIDGKLTAGWHAKQVKNNTQLKSFSPLAESVTKTLSSLLLKNSLFQAAAYPKSIHKILVSRYETGMSYGSHVDNAFMAGKRTDISFTIFLNAPDSYQGGELSIELSDGDRLCKLEAGSAVVYPSSTLHQVMEVSEGVRLVAAGWAESYIRDPAKRELLFELDTVKRLLFKKSGKSVEFDLVAKSHSNLLRQWAE
ncbi:MAG: Fe2+-dependent dioxygenase [Cyanobacteria bacterium P01_F01_bin.42]